MSRPIVTLTTTFSFEAAHRLVKGYPGRCQNLHGHSFRITCEIKGLQLNQFGMLKDFADFKVIKDWCKENWDHATLLADSDELTIEFLRSTRQRHFVFNDNPTSEVIALYLLEKSADLGFPLDAVTIDETCTHSCTVRR